MSKYDLGFIGTGSMGGALAACPCRKFPAKVILSNRTMARAQALAEKYGCAAGSFAETARESRYIIIGTLPGAVCGVISEILPEIKASGERKVIVSMSGSTSLADMEAMAGDVPVIRILPNTPVAVGRGLIFYCAGKNATDGDVNGLMALMSCCGSFEQLDERLFGAGSAVAGCGPAFAAIFIDALADGGVLAGIPRASAIRFAEQMLLGTAQLALDTGKHPAQLRDEVASPGGATIEGIRALEEGGLRASVIDAVVRAWKKH